MEVRAEDNGAAGPGERGRPRWVAVLLRRRPAGPFTFGASGDVYVCEKERKRLRLPWPYGV